MASPDENKARLRALILELRDEQGLTYQALADRLRRDHGCDISPTVLNNRINRGNFSAGFALTVLEALGAKHLELTTPPARLRAK